MLRRDPYKLEAAKFRIHDIAAEGKPIAETRDEILEQLEIISDNTPKDDWADNLFMGTAYFLLGDKSKGMDCIAVNLDFGYENKISGMLFSQMEKGQLNSSEAQEMIHKMGLEELIASIKISDKDSALVMALYFEGNGNALEELANSNDNPVVFHALRLIEQSKGSSQNYAKVKEYVRRHDALKDKIRDSYSDIVPLVNKYVNENRENAEIFMADMLMYGLGVEQDTKKAEEMFSRLAENGNVYAQFVMIQSHLAPVVQAPKQETTSQKEYTRQELEALGVRSFSPTGLVPNNVSFRVVFSMQMVTRAQISKTITSGNQLFPFDVNPPLQLEGRWQNERTFVSRLLAPLQAATTYTATLRENLKDRSGKRIGPAEFIFTTEATQTPTLKLTRKQIEDLYQWGEKYYLGRGIPQNQAKAFEYFSQAAEGGHAGAQWRLGSMYRYGIGVNRDLRKAREWLEKAADQGNGLARSSLYTLNKNGR